MGPHERISDRSRLQPSIRREETMTMTCSYFHVNRVFHVDAPQFGEEYPAYRRRVPMFIPRPGQWRQLVERCSASGDQDDPPRG